jgi:aminoglycoside phosphotransferase (APT) family kinase protein
MDKPETVARLLNAFGVTSDRPLGSGQESDVFAIDDRRVLRLYRRPPDQQHLAQLANFYTRLDRRDAPFMVPEIIDFGERDGIAYAVEVRVGGIDLAKALGRMVGKARFQAIRNYVDAAAAIRSLKHPQAQFGEVIAASPVRRETWAEFVVARAVQGLEEHRRLLIGVLEHPERGISALEARLASRAAASPNLVHGDYFPENVVVADDSRVCGVIDFGALTLIGDADLDLACAVLNLTGMAGVTPEDRLVALKRAEALGLTRETLDLYSLYYAFRFLGARRENDGLFRWCVRTIREACGPYFC